MRFRPAALAAILVALAACSDSTAPKAVATTVELASATAATGTVGQNLVAAPTFVVKDQSGKVMSDVPVTVTVTTGGGTIAGAPAVSGTGPIPVGQWTLGRTAGVNTLTITAGSLKSIVVSATGTADVPASVAVRSGDGQSAPAGTAVPVVARVAVLDQYGNGVPGQTATFAVLAGGGVLSATTATSGADGTVAVPAWTLGRSAVPQQLTVTIAGRTGTVNATVLTAYTIDVRFYGAPMTAAQQALFTTAAARIRGAVVGQLSRVDVTGAEPDSECGTIGVGPLAEITDGVIIYASVADIDGVGKTLAKAGPCYVRSATDVRTLVGVMQFDAADLPSLGTGQVLQDVITHEMLHVVGVGTYWKYKSLITGFDTPEVAYTGVAGIAGCQAVGGTTTCAVSVPVENQGGAGTANAHWREATFDSELMTGYVERGTMPLSAMTIRSLVDIGYSVNLASADPYSIFTGSLRASSDESVGSPLPRDWEGSVAFRPIPIATARLQAATRASARAARLSAGSGR